MSKKNFKFISISIIILILILILMNDRLTFTYYVWNLSSEDYNTREHYAKLIKAKGHKYEKLILKELDSPYIYETDYLIYCLEDINGVKGSYNDLDSAIKFWKNYYNKKK